MDFTSKAEIFKSLRSGMSAEVERCLTLTGKKRVKTDPVNKKLWGELYKALLAEADATANKEKWESSRVLDAQLRLFYCSLVVNLETRNRVVPYDYMDFARRIGALC